MRTAKTIIHWEPDSGMPWAGETSEHWWVEGKPNQWVETETQAEPGDEETIASWFDPEPDVDGRCWRPITATRRYLDYTTQGRGSVEFFD